MKCNICYVNMLAQHGRLHITHYVVVSSRTQSTPQKLPGMVLTSFASWQHQDQLLGSSRSTTRSLLCIHPIIADGWVPGIHYSTYWIHTHRQKGKHTESLRQCFHSCHSFPACMWILFVKPFSSFILGLNIFIRSFIQSLIVWNQWRCRKQQALWFWLSEGKTETSMPTKL